MSTTTRPRGRPRAFAEDAALDAAMLAFWRNGYRRTSMDDLVEATGAARASLYKTFGDKRAIFIKSLYLYAERFEARADAVLAVERDMPAAARTILIASAERLAGTSAPAGCLRCNSTLEVMGADAEIDAALRMANDRFLAVMGRLVQLGVEAGLVAPADKARFALFLTGTVSGMVSLARAGAAAEDLRGFAETALEVLARTTLPPGCV